MYIRSHICILLCLLLFINHINAIDTLSLVTVPVSCPGINDGKTLISINPKEFPVIVKMFNVQKNVLVQSLVFYRADTLSIENLSAGVYDVKRYFNNVLADSVRIEITEPKSLAYSKIIVIKIPQDDVACDGSLIAIAVGGTPPYTYRWKHNESKNEVLDHVCWGTYTCFINDANNCGQVKADIPFYMDMKEYFEYQTNKP